MTLKLDKQLTLDVNDIAVVWRASVMVYDTARDEDGMVELLERPFNIAREADAQEWIDEQCAAMRAKHGIAS
jgi:hypothetical protein